MQPTIFHKRPNWDNWDNWDNREINSGVLQHWESEFQTVMTRRKRCDRIIKANEDTWLHSLIIVHFYEPSAQINRMSHTSHLCPPPELCPWLRCGRRLSLESCVTVILHWCCSSLTRLFSHTWSNIWMSVQHWCPWRQRWARGPLSNTRVVSGPECFSSSSALPSCRFPCGYMLRRIFQSYRDYMHIYVALQQNDTMTIQAEAWTCCCVPI